MSPEKTARFWQSATRSLARRVNLGWWLERWMGWVLGVALIGAVAVLFVRWMPLVELRWVWGALGGIIVLGALIAWLTVRRHFESAATARVRLEDALNLKTRLSAAEAGVGDWPQSVERIAWPVRWQWQRPLSVLGISALMLTLAAWVPISQKALAKQRVIEKPSAVKEVENWMQSLKQEQAAEEKSLDEVEKKIAEMLQRPAENWYEHGSLEAADNLKDQTAEMLRQLAENLGDAERAASALKAAGDAMPQEARDAVGKELANAAQGLRTGGIKPNEQLLKQLQQMAAAQGMGELTKEQLEALSKQLQANAKALAEALKNSPELKLGECLGNCLKPGEKPGKGGINRGPGTAPLTFGKDETNLDSKKTEALQSQLDVARLAPGDVLGVSDGKHEVDKNAPNGPQQGGTIQNTGDGGAAVWQNSLLPSEREALRRYFK
ncbi:MAG: hypothetical protein ACOYMN_09840 [Roseimicrobium sp.]